MDEPPCKRGPEMKPGCYAKEVTGSDLVSEQLVSASFSSGVWFHPALAPQLRTKHEGPIS